MLRTITVDPTALAYLAVGATLWGVISALLKTRRDRTVEYLQLQLTDARRELHKLQGQVELLERAGFSAIHTDHQMILSELRVRKE